MKKSKVICELTCYAYQNSAGEDLSQNDYIIGIFDGFRQF